MASGNPPSPRGNNPPAPLSRGMRLLVLVIAFSGLLFDGVELGLMPIASLSVSRSLLGAGFTDAVAGVWFARFTASLMLGAAVGGIVLGELGDRFGRRTAMGISILFYSVFAGMGAFVQTQEQMLALRFFVGLGAGGMVPNGVALVSECWPNASRPLVSGVMGAGINAGILLLSQLARFRPITPDSWRWLFQLSAAPATIGILTFLLLPESPTWLAGRGSAKKRGTPISELLRPPLLRITVIGILLGSIPMVGAWAASKWMIPWADHAMGTAHPGYKAIVQGWWALGATIGSFLGAQIASLLGRRLTYFLISLGASCLTAAMFLLTAPAESSFLPVVFAQGFVATLFFGWLPLYLPELFPTRVRATGTGISFNAGRFATALGVFFAGGLFAAFGGSYPKVGATCGLVYALGMLVVWWAPDTTGKTLDQ
jgi:MFS transporter, SHS family, sialic acid transporter